jgi:hypothetical protein
MKVTLFVFVFLALFSTAYSQSNTEPIEIKKAGTFFQNGKRLSVRQLIKITQSNSEAHKKMTVARANSDVASILGFAGGFLIGYPLGASLTGREANWTLAGIGAGLALVSIPFNSGYRKHAYEAVDLYNQGLRQTGRKAILKLGLASNAVKLKLAF